MQLAQRDDSMSSPTDQTILIPDPIPERGDPATERFHLRSMSFYLR
ncbi:hypothetical protein S7335_272 [Synechococcus sp. PCC 7335]|nr:hypothetical protein S7335_272 [Synechococcus sp. PCC 7335]